MVNDPFDEEGNIDSSIEGTSTIKKPIRGITVEEAERRDRDYIQNLRLDAQRAKSHELYKSMLYWFAIYNSIGLIIILFYQDEGIKQLLYRVGLGVIIAASMMMAATFIGGMRTFAVPGMMIVVDKHLGVMDDIRNAKERVFNSIGGPIQGLVYGIILIFFGVQ